MSANYSTVLAFPLFPLWELNYKSVMKRWRFGLLLACLISASLGGQDQRFHWTTTRPLASARGCEHSCPRGRAGGHQMPGRKCNECLHKQIHCPAGGYGRSPARDLLQSRQSISYLCIYTIHLLQAREKKRSQRSSRAGGTITVSRCGACLRDSCGGGTGWSLAGGEVTWRGHKKMH